MGALAIRNIHKTYNDTVHILKGIDLEIEAGEFLILVGPSGCGKSTLLSMIAGLDHPTSGSIHIGDRDVTNLPSKDRDIAMVFQNYALYPNMTVAQNIAYPLSVRGCPDLERQAKVAKAPLATSVSNVSDTAVPLDVNEIEPLPALPAMMIPVIRFAGPGNRAAPIRSG